MAISTRTARRLRPVATERARQQRIREGQTVFYGGIVWGTVTVHKVFDGKPYYAAILEGRSAMFFGALAYAYPSQAEYNASGVHWNAPPKLGRH